MSSKTISAPQPLHDFVLLQREGEKTRKSGLIIPETAASAQYAIVAAMGPGRVTSGGHRIDPSEHLCLGDRVMLHKDVSGGFRWGNDMLFLVTYDDIACVLPAEEPESYIVEASQIQ